MISAPVVSAPVVSTPVVGASFATSGPERESASLASTSPKNLEPSFQSAPSVGVFTILFLSPIITRNYASGHTLTGFAYF